jgi:hypothetical protein
MVPPVPVPADTIALVNTDPRPGFANNAVTPIVYTPIQYGGVGHNIQAADVPPPAWLNIDPKVVNKVAIEREARTAAPRPVNSVATATSVVNPALATAMGAALAAFNPQLPQISVAAAPGSLQALLRDGEWGNAFIGLVQDIRTPIRITTASIDAIFKWGKSVTRVLPGTPTLCRDSYVQAMTNLLQLPSGVRLFRDIIIAHHTMPDLPGVKFTSKNQKESKYESFPYPAPSKINLKWDGVNSVHPGDNFVLIAKNNAVAADPNHLGKELDFMDVAVPNWMVLAHELGHYLYDLIAHKRSINLNANIISKAIVDSTPDVCVMYAAAMAAMSTDNKNGMISGAIDCYSKKEYEEILKRIIQDPPSDAKKAFVDSWNHDGLDELVNILPTANVLQHLNGDSWGGGSSYSDGAIIGEAVLQGTITIPPVGGHGVVHAGLTPESFVRFSHQGTGDFEDTLRDLLRDAVTAAVIPGPGMSTQMVNDVVDAIIAAAGSAANVGHAALIPPAPATIAAAITNAVGTRRMAMATRVARATAAINAAVGAMQEFKDLTATMLGLITIPNPAGGPWIALTAANLPNF